MRQEQLFYTINGDDELLKRTFILNIPTLVAKPVEEMIKAKSYNINRASLANIYAIVETVSRKHCYTQKLRRPVNQIEKYSMTRFCKQDIQMFRRFDTTHAYHYNAKKKNAWLK